MPYQVDAAVRHAMSGTELSRVRTELRLLPRQHINSRMLASRAADIVMQSSPVLGLQVSDYGVYLRFADRSDLTQNNVQKVQERWRTALV